MAARISAFRLVISALVLAGCTILAGQSPSVAAEGRFVPGFEDLPLMAGLVAIDEAGTVFDTPAGRIVESYARGPVSADAVAAFYKETLPALGWVESAFLIFDREGEALEISIEPARVRKDSEALSDSPDAPIIVRFALAPN